MTKTVVTLLIGAVAACLVIGSLVWVRPSRDTVLTVIGSRRAPLLEPFAMRFVEPDLATDYTIINILPDPATDYLAEAIQPR